MDQRIRVHGGDLVAENSPAAKFFALDANAVDDWRIRPKCHVSLEN